MIKTIEKTMHLATKCPECNGILINPGQNRQKLYCCGKYRQWFDVVETTKIVDDGRDSRGRFHHKPHTVQYTEQTIEKGGY